MQKFTREKKIEREKKVQCHSFSLLQLLNEFSLSNQNYFLILIGVSGQDEEDGPYRGKFIGKFNSYHHQVGGDVYAVDANTFLIVNFNYDGNGVDTFFWSGASNRPGPQGFIVPDEYGK